MSEEGQVSRQNFARAIRKEEASCYHDGTPVPEYAVVFWETDRAYHYADIDFECVFTKRKTKHGSWGRVSWDCNDQGDAFRSLAISLAIAESKAGGMMGPEESKAFLTRLANPGVSSS